MMQVFISCLLIIGYFNVFAKQHLNIITTIYNTSKVIPASETLTLECPEYQVKSNNRNVWLKDGQVFKNRKHTRKIIRKDGYIQLPDMISIVDEGVYTCEVKNDTHVTRREYDVKVYARPKEIKEKSPLFTEKPRNTTAMIGDNISTCCIAVSDSPKRMIWLKHYKVNDSYYDEEGCANFFTQLKDLLSKEMTFVQGKQKSLKHSCLDPVQKIFHTKLVCELCPIRTDGCYERQHYDDHIHVLNCKEFITNSNGLIHVNDTCLVIMNFTLGDAGIYSCYASNEFGGVHESFKISVSKTLSLESNRNNSSNKNFFEDNMIIFGAVAVVIFIILIIIIIGLIHVCGKIMRKNTAARCPKSQVLKKQWEIPAHSLQLFEPVGEGAFGFVQRGLMKGKIASGKQQLTTVAVKSLKNISSEKGLSDLITEMETMKAVGHHENIIQCFGWSFKPDTGSLMIIMEYAASGNLKDLLRMYNLKQTNQFSFVNQMKYDSKDSSYIDLAHYNLKDELTYDHLVRFSYQVSKGMAYLASKKVIHRDVAARNILIAKDGIAKISDFGLTRNMMTSPKDYYRHITEGRLPIKWMAPESMATKVYTSKSDVWSFGVLLWEIFTYGSNPYPTVPVQNLYMLLKDGYRMERPFAASSMIYKIMKDCWHFHPDNRPTFSELTIELSTLLNNATAPSLDCLNFVNNNETYFLLEQ